jgi:hypothetical protein
MRTIERSSAFKRDYKRAKATPRHGKDLDSLSALGLPGGMRSPFVVWRENV